MSEIDKQYYQGKRIFKLFGIKIFEIEQMFITTATPNKEYFEKEFLNKKER